MKSFASYRESALPWLRSLLRLRSGKIETARDRSRERYRRAAMTAAATSFSKIVSMAASILTVRLTFRYLGAERYGMWMTITSVVMMMGFADLGIGNGLINIMADAVGRKDWREARKVSASGFWTLCVIAALLALGMAAAYPFINTSRLFNLRSPLAVHEAGPALLVFFYCFVLNVPLFAIRNIQTGMQNGFVNNLWDSLGSIASLGALLLAIRAHGGLPLLVLSLAAPPVAVTMLNGLELFGRSHPELRPSPSAFSRESASRLFHTGMMFFLLQLAMSIGMQTDNIVIAQILGAKSVAAYAVPARLFSMVNAFLIMLSGAMWPAYADAVAHSDGPWIRRSFRRVAVGGTALTIIAAVFLAIFGNQILAVWVGPQIHASAALLAVFGLQCILYAYLQPMNFLLNGVGRLQVQVICALVMAMLNLALSILFVIHYGIIGAVLGTVISVLVAQAVPLTILTRNILRKFSQSSLEPHSESTEAVNQGPN